MSFTENAKDATDAIMKLDRAIATGYADARCIDKDGNNLSRAELELKAKHEAAAFLSADRTPR